VKRVSVLAFVMLGLATAAALVLLVSPHASSEPDGLERAAARTGIDEGADGHALAGSPFAGYGVFAGLLGAGVAFAVAGGSVVVVRRLRRPDPS
jgi:hypothetical protein